MHHAAPVRRAAGHRHTRTVAYFLLALSGVSGACAQAPSPPDTILINGKVVVYDAPAAQALAIRGDTISAIGTTTALRALAGPATRIIELGGRTVIPGLIDSHIHAIRAGVSYATEVHWSDLPTLRQALGRLRQAAHTTPKGSWLVVAGGWSERQFREDRLPTQAEISAAAPHHRVYIQKFYSSVLLDPAGATALGIADHPAWSARLSRERDAGGRPNGWLTGDNRAISDLYNLLPRPDYAQKLAGTRAFFRRLNSMGVTGVNDPGGYNIDEDDYRPLFQLWRDRSLTLRVRYSLSAPRRDHELEDFQRLTRQLPMGSGDAWLRFNGIGENVTWGLYNNDQPDTAQKAQLEAVLRWAVSRNMTATFHWHNNRPLHHLLEVVARVNADTPVAPLRWSVAHLNDASPDTLQRLHTLGLGWLVQNAFYFRGEAFLGQRGADAARSAPPIASALRLQLPVGGGTDAHRVMTPNPFVSLQWMLDGKTVSGVAMRSAAETPTRIAALRLYTQGSAWFSFEENSRGALATGQLADLAVLNRDYLGVPLHQIGGITSVLTMVGGRIVYGSGPYVTLEEKPR